MAILLSLLSALAYGASDFGAGLASRSFAAGPVALIEQSLGLATALVALVLFGGHGATVAVLEWGALSGLGSAIGTWALYHGLAVARMSVVSTLSAVLTAVIPVIVGLTEGNRLGAVTAVGIVIAVPAIALVSWQPGADGRRDVWSGPVFGCLAGAGFALLFISLDRAGTHSGAWPLVFGQALSVSLITPFAYRGVRATGRPTRRTLGLTLGAGLLSGVANLLFLAATGHGELAIVAVVTALYPAATVVLARFALAEHWTRLQLAGLITAAVAIVLVTAG